MRSLRSAILWTTGGLYFLFMFVVLAAALSLISPERLFPLVRKMMRLQLALVGIRLRVFGLDRFDPDGTYLIAGNHESLFDMFAIPAALPGHAVGIEASYHFSIPLWGFLIRRWGNIPAHRRNPERGIRSLNSAASVLKAGTSIVVLPEGGRSRDGGLRPFKKGPFHLAIRAEADILPMVLAGMYDFNNVGSWHLNPGTVAVVFGDPIPFERYRGMSPEVLSDTVRKKMMDLKAGLSGDVASPKR